MTLLVSTNLDSLKRLTWASNSARILKSSTLLFSCLICHKVDRKEPMNHTIGKFSSSEDSKLILNISAWEMLGINFLITWRRKSPVPWLLLHSKNARSKVSTTCSSLLQSEQNGDWFGKILEILPLVGRIWLRSLKSAEVWT